MKYEPEVWLKAYRADGFVIVPALLDPHTLATLRAGLAGIVAKHDTLTPELKGKLFFEHQHVRNNPHWYVGRMTPEECGDAVRQIDDLALFDQSFAALICYTPLLDVLETLFASPEFSFNYLVARPKAARVGNGISDGHFHRDTPFERFTAVNTILAILCLDDMTSENGATEFIRASHQVSDEEAKRPQWREVAPEELNRAERVTAQCPAGAGLFFNTKILHAAGHNRSAYPRDTLICEWVGPDILPTAPERHAYQGLKPRSKDPVCAQQIRLTFPELSAGQV